MSIRFHNFPQLRDFLLEAGKDLSHKNVVDNKNMMGIFQHIIIGINDAGRKVLQDTSKILRTHDYALMEDLAIRLHIVTGENGSLKIFPYNYEKDTEQTGLEDMAPFTPESAKTPKERPVENRRQFAYSLCQAYTDLEKLIKSEWERLTRQDDFLQLGKAGLSCTGKKVTIVADLGDGASSALIIPLLGALQYLLRDESIPTNHWSVLGMINLRETPGAKVHSYAFLKELTYLKKTDDPVPLHLKTPLIDKEIDLSEVDCALFLLDARSRGMTPIPLTALSETAARSIFLETFFERRPIKPPDNELYFNSFGIGECLFPINEIMDVVSAKETAGVIQHYRDQPGLADKVRESVSSDLEEKIAQEYLTLETEIPEVETVYWEPLQPAPEDYTTAEALTRLSEEFTQHRISQEKKVIERLVPGVKNPRYQALAHMVDRLMNDYYFGPVVAAKVLDDTGNRIFENLQALGKVDRAPETFQENRQVPDINLEETLKANAPMVTVFFAFLFVLFPFGMALLHFLQWKYAGLPFGKTFFIISMVILAVAFAGSWSRRGTISGKLKESFRDYVNHLQESNEKRFTKNVKRALEDFYADLHYLIHGSDRSRASLVTSGTKSLEPLREKVNRYLDVIKGQRYLFLPKPAKFYTALYLYDPGVEEELNYFLTTFLGEEYTMTSLTPLQRSARLYEHMKVENYDWYTVLDTQDGAQNVFKIWRKNFIDYFSGATRNIRLGIWDVIRKTDDTKLNLLSERLVEMSNPLIRIQDYRMPGEFTGTGEKFVFLTNDGMDMPFLQKMITMDGFEFQEIRAFSHYFIVLQLCRMLQVYKLAYLNDWQYFEDRLEPDTKRNLYIADAIIHYPHIDYNSRTKEATA